MNDEIQQAQKETFDHIILGIILFGFIAAIATGVNYGIGSPWFWRAMALLFIAVVSLVVRLLGHMTLASYALVVQLVLLVSQGVISSGTLSTFGLYLFVPVIVITGLLLSPLATLLTTLAIVVGMFLIAALTDKFAVSAISPLIPPLGLTAIVGILTAKSKQNFIGLGQCLVENRIILRQRTLEMMETLKRVETLQQEIVDTRKKLRLVEAEVSKNKTMVTQRSNQLFDLFQGVVTMLNRSLLDLEDSLEQIGEHPHLNGQAKALESAWQRVYLLKSMMVNVEEITQVERDDLALNLTEVNAAQLLYEVSGIARGLAREKKLEIRTQTSDNLPPLQADPIRLRQVLLQLLNNAVKFTDRGIIEIRAEQQKQEVILSVSDTGMGMSQEEAEAIFEKFSQGNRQTQAQQGVGLGLAISKRLVDLHGGRMWATSVKGVGSTFYVALPAASKPLKTPVQKTVAAAAVQQRLDKLDFNPPVSKVPKSDTRATITNPDDGGTLVIARSPLAKESGATFSMPASAFADDDGRTLILSKQILDIAEAKQNSVSAALTAVIPNPSDKIDFTIPKVSSRPQPREATGPIYRYMSMYIQRFGIIMLGLLLIVVTLVATLAIATHLAGIQTPASATAAATAAAIALAAATPTSAIVQVEAITPTTVSTPTIKAAINVGPPSATPLSQPTATAIKLSPTELPVPTATPLATASPVLPTPSPTESPTSTPTLPPTKTPTLPPTKTATLIPAPTATPGPQNGSAIPAAVVETVKAVPSKLYFVDAQQQVTRFDFASNTVDTVPILPNRNSRISWSPHGQALYAAAPNGNQDIYVVNPASGQPIQLTSEPGDDMQPAWSPDGNKIAFSSGRSGSFDIYVANADGGNPIALTSSRGFDEWPAWSPDSRQLAFVSDRDGNVELYVMLADGSNQQRLTNHPADDWPAAWSPDGHWLVFASNRDGNWNLYVIAASGGETQRLTNTPGDERDPIWAADGTSIAFTHHNGSNWDIYTLPVSLLNITEVSATDWQQITNTPVDERYPAWSQP